MVDCPWPAGRFPPRDGLRWVAYRPVGASVGPKVEWRVGPRASWKAGKTVASWASKHLVAATAGKHLVAATAGKPKADDSECEIARPRDLVGHPPTAPSRAAPPHVRPRVHLWPRRVQASRRTLIQSNR